METNNETRLARMLRQVSERKRSRQGLEGAESGFTLIELMVVLLIMAILLAIAIPTFLGVKGSAQDRAVQSNLTNALTSAKAAYANSGSYATAASLEVTALSSAEPNLSFTAGAAAAAGQNTVSVNVSTDGGQLLLVGWSAAGNCWAAEDNESDNGGDSGNAIAHTPSTAGVQYAEWAYSTSNPCTNSVPAVTNLVGGAWSSNYP